MSGAAFLMDHRTPAQVCDAWHPEDVATVALRDPDPVGFIRDAAAVARVSLLCVGAPRQVAIDWGRLILDAGMARIEARTAMFREIAGTRDIEGAAA
jgi:hypothetical protein